MTRDTALNGLHNCGAGLHAAVAAAISGLQSGGHRAGRQPALGQHAQGGQQPVHRGPPIVWHFRRAVARQKGAPHSPRFQRGRLQSGMLAS